MNNLETLTTAGTKIRGAYTTKQIRLAITLQPILFLQRAILEEYTPLLVKQFREEKKLQAFEAVKISNEQP